MEITLGIDGCGIGCYQLHQEAPMEDHLPIGMIHALSDTDPMQALYTEAISKSQRGEHDNLLKRLRFYVLAQLAAAACRRFPDLDFVECGCWRGHSTVMLSTILRRNGFRGTLHVFDSFEGLSDYTDEDRSAFVTTPKEEARMKAWFKSDPTHVAKLTKEFGFVRLYPGWIPSRFLDVSKRRFAFLSVDVDLYEPTKDSLSFFLPRLVDGGHMFFDDYGYTNFPGARKAVDEIFAVTPPSQFFHMPYGSAIAIK
jgi:hypothetical protein